MAYYENVSLEKGMYSTPGKSFTQVLEELDSSENYRGTPLEGLDAYQRQLKRFGIRVSGPGSGTVEKFFQSSSSAALFPEYVSRAVALGMESANKIQDLVATVTKIDALDYRPISTDVDTAAPALAVTAEGSQLPSTNIRMSASLVKLQKRGRMLVSSYEALRFQKLDLLTVALRQIGAYIAAAQTKDAVDVLTGSGDNALEFTEGGTPNYGDFVALWAALAPYELNTVVAGTAVIQKLLQIPEFKDAQAGMNFQGTGKLCSPLGANLIPVPEMAANKILALDKNCALEMVQAGEISVDYDKLIDKQLERAAISMTCGFSKIFPNAVAGLDCTPKA